jgi:hypothetical protein
MFPNFTIVNEYRKSINMKLPGAFPAGTLMGITPQSDMQACVRKGNLDGKPVQHCYLRLTDDTGNIEDSISYGPDENGSPDKNPGSPTQCNTIRKDISPASWDSVKRYYREQCAGREFSLNENDCCSCAASAVNVLGEHAPDFILSANKT